MEKDRKVVILGASAIAEIAYEYFTYDSNYEVVAFSVDREYLKETSLFGLPVVPFDELPRCYAPAEHCFLAATNYNRHNALRKRFYQEAKALGYTPASYVSSRAFVWRNCQVGEHCFIFEDNTLQPFSRTGNNVVLWSGNHIGHHSTIGDHTFVSSHVVISGFVAIGESCFLGVNSTFANDISVGNNCVVGAGALVIGNVPDDQTVVGLWKKQG
jgi:sugar O-acyltransferase (sialic acid O-acetyltransferase NeuD family)